MMALATSPLQGSCSSYPSIPWFHAIGRKNGFISLKSNPGLTGRLRFSPNFRSISLKSRSCLSDGASLDLWSKSRLLKVSAFKGGIQHDDSRGRTSNFQKSPVKVSYLQHDSEESSLESSEVQIAPYALADETGTRSRAIQDLFKKWLLIMRTAPQTNPVDEVLEEPSSAGASEVPTEVQNQEGSAISKPSRFDFLGVDAIIKIPLLIFVPLYLAVNLAYGPQVAKELTPLWFLGPVAVACYIELFRRICALYVFAFKQTAPVVKNLPAYYFLAHSYIVGGKLKESMQKHIWRYVEDMRKMDYNDVARGKTMVQGWLVERQLDFVESIWPYYCRTFRLFKRMTYSRSA